jgi:uncharacterized protein (TIGR00297 family)
LLIAFFISGTLLSRYKAQTKFERLSGIPEKGGERDAWQVVANGGVFTAAAVIDILNPSQLWLCAGAGAIAASTADTWATELGSLSTRMPRSITTGRRVNTGTSGGVSWRGTAAAVAGSAFIGLVTFLCGWQLVPVISSLIGGITGSVIDSLLGAAFQVKRWCDQCKKPTELTVHGCGTTTRVVGGLVWLNNDGVNAISSACGAAMGMLCYLLVQR